MDEDFTQVINNKEVEKLLKQALVARRIDNSLFEEKIIDLLETYPDISRDRVDEILSYYTLKIASERLNQPNNQKGYTESTLDTYKSFNAKLRHLYIAGKYKSVFDLNISNLSRLSNISVDVIAKMLNEITVPIEAEVVQETSFVVMIKGWLGQIAGTALRLLGQVKNLRSQVMVRYANQGTPGVSMSFFGWLRGLDLKHPRIVRDRLLWDKKKKM
jgi:hypothetical protein